MENQRMQETPGRRGDSEPGIKKGGAEEADGHNPREIAPPDAPDEPTEPEATEEPGDSSSEGSEPE